MDKKYMVIEPIEDLDIQAKAGTTAIFKIDRFESLSQAYVYWSQMGQKRQIVKIIEPIVIEK
jgi:hypothetical protein